MNIKGEQFTEFISRNGLKMVEGKWINWQKSPIYRDVDEPFVLSFSMGDMGGMWNANYYWEDDRLIISNLAYSSNESIEFWVNSLEMAEMIALSCVKGKGLKVLPLYDKDLNSWNQI